jgi:hypothetical protein
MYFNENNNDGQKTVVIMEPGTDNKTPSWIGLVANVSVLYFTIKMKYRYRNYF